MIFVNALEMLIDSKTSTGKNQREVGLLLEG
jgi:hypothetical protein